MQQNLNLWIMGIKCILLWKKVNFIADKSVLVLSSRIIKVLNAHS